MRTEKFDEAVRQKIESVNPSFEDHEIERVHQYVLKNRGRLPFTRSGYFISAAAAGLIITGLLFLNLKEMKDEKRLAETIKDLKQDIVQKEATPLVVKPETVYVKEVVHDLPPNTAVSAKKTAINIENSTPPQKQIVASSMTNEPIIPNSEKSLAKKDSKITKEPETVTKTKELPTITNQHPLSSPIITNNKDTVASKEKVTPKEDILVQNEVDGENKTAPQTFNNTPSGQNELVSKETTSNVTPTVISSENKTNTDNATNSNEMKPDYKANSPFSTIQFRFGIGAEKAHTLLGFKAFGDIILGGRWGLRAGIKYLIVGGRSYGSKDEYREKEGKDFDEDGNDDNGSGNTNPKNISDINIQDNVIQVPIALSYRMPLKHNFSLSFGIGTDIDVYSTQNVSFKVSQLAANDVQRTVAHNPTPSIFNNAVASVGIEKRFRFLNFDLQPFVSSQLSTVTYKKEKYYYGLNLSAIYVFGG